MSHVSIWVHVVWGTKGRAPLLSKPHRQTVFDHIRENAKSKHIHVDHINGHKDHVHCLISLDADQSISKVVQLLKGESSFWINKSKIFDYDFSWSRDYYAVSIGLDSIPTVRDYIRNQEEHHRDLTFTHECDRFIKKYGFKHYLE